MNIELFNRPTNYMKSFLCRFRISIELLQKQGGFFAAYACAKVNDPRKMVD